MKKTTLILSLAALCLATTGPAQADFAAFMSGFPTIPPGQDGPLDDPDKDGLVNQIEYAVDGMDPSIPDNDNFPKPQTVGGNFAYSIPKRPTATEASYEIQRDEDGDPATLAFVTATSGVTEDAASITYTTALASAARDFVRLGVDLVPVGALPTNNPVTECYPGEYAWSDNIDWATVVNVADFGAVADGLMNPVDATQQNSATDNLAAFQAAIADVETLGGGVVYVPAGNYFLSDTLELPANVVLRGEKPALTDAHDASFDPPSRLIFPKYFPTFTGSGTPLNTAFKRIILADVPNSGKNGVVWMNVNRAAIQFDYDPATRSPGSFDQNAPTGMNFVLLGVRSNNGARVINAEGLPEWDNPSGFNIYSENLGWERYIFQFAAPIHVSSSGNTIIAKCRVNDLSWQSTLAFAVPGAPSSSNYLDDSYEQIGAKPKNVNLPYPFFTDFPDPGQLPVRFSDSYVISLNGLYHFARNPHAPNGWFGTETQTPYLFRENHTVRDNWLFGTAGTKLEASGKGLEIINNVSRDVPYKSFLVNSVGFNTTNAGSEVMSRGFLIGGADIQLVDNDIYLYRHQYVNPSNPGVATGIFSNDAEGVLWDNTTTICDGYNAVGNTTNANIFVFDTNQMDNIYIADNHFDRTELYGPNALPRGYILHGAVPIWLRADSLVGALPSLNVVVENNTGFHDEFPNDFRAAFCTVIISNSAGLDPADTTSGFFNNTSADLNPVDSTPDLMDIRIDQPLIDDGFGYSGNVNFNLQVFVP